MQHSIGYCFALPPLGMALRMLMAFTYLPGFVTNLAELTPSQVVGIYQKRWAIELMHWELQAGLGLGEHQVSGDTHRSETSVGIAVLAYLFVLCVCHHEIVPGKPWSLFQLQHALWLRVMTNQVEHKVKGRMAKTRKAA